MKKRRLKLLLALCLAVMLLTTGALAADEAGERLFVGGTELVGSADAPAYAVTDADGAVTPGGGEDNYNVKWDGTTLTLRDANIEGRYTFDAEQYESAAGIFRMGDLELEIIGLNSVVCPDVEGTDGMGIYVADGALTISGSGSLEAWGSYDGISNTNGGVTVTGGTLSAKGGSGGISVYDGGLKITGGEVTAVSDGSYVDSFGETDMVCGAYIQGSVELSGGSFTVSADSKNELIDLIWGLYIYGQGNDAVITGGTLTASTNGEYCAAIYCSDQMLLTGGSVTVSNPAENGYGIYATDIDVSGGTLLAEVASLPLYPENDLIISGGSVTTEGHWSLFAYKGDIVISGGTVTSNAAERAVYAPEGRVLISPQDGLQLSVSAGDGAAGAADIQGSPFRTETDITGLVSEQKYFRCISIPRTASIFVGDLELTTTDGVPVYAVTDKTGTVTPGGGESNYNVRWDGMTLTLRDANITGSNFYDFEEENEPNLYAAILGLTAYELELVGDSTVTGPTLSNNAHSTGIASLGGLTICGDGSVTATGDYDGIMSQYSDLMITGGTIVADGGNGGISTYSGKLTITGGDITARARGEYRTPGYGEDDSDVSYAIYADGECLISGGNITVTATGEAEYIHTVAGIFVYADSDLTVTGGNITVNSENKYGYSYGIYCYEDINISGGTINACGESANKSGCGIYSCTNISISGGTITACGNFGGIDADSDLVITGGTINASIAGETINSVTLDGEEYVFGIMAFDNLKVSGGTVNADGIYSRLSMYFDGGVVNSSGEDMAASIYAFMGDINISGGTVTATGGKNALYAADGEINIAIADGREVAVCAGKSAASASALAGSPFLEAAVISELVEGQKYFHSVGAIPFTDISGYAWYYNAVKYAYANGLMEGTSDTAFAPDGTMTRAMVVTILWRQAGEPVVNYAMDFADVAEGAWYTEAVRWAASAGIVTGYGNGAFGTGDAITREQLAAILYRYAQVKGYDTSVGEDTNILSYADALEISEYAIPAMQWACGAGILEGNAGHLYPQGDATRAEVATMLMRFCEEYVVW